MPTGQTDGRNIINGYLSAVKGFLGNNRYSEYIYTNIVYTYIHTIGFYPANKYAHKYDGHYIQCLLLIIVIIKNYYFEELHTGCAREPVNQNILI